MWILDNQLGRRNLTRDQYTLMLGALHEAEKLTKAQAGARGGSSMSHYDSCFTRDQYTLLLGALHDAEKREGWQRLRGQNDPVVRTRDRLAGGRMDSRTDTGQVPGPPVTTAPAERPAWSAASG